MKCTLIAIEQMGEHFMEIRTEIDYDSIQDAINDFAKNPPPSTVVGLILVPAEIKVIDLSAPGQN